MTNAKKSRKTIEWESLEISSRKLEIPKLVTIKDINGMDLIEAEHIKKKWQQNTEKLHKKYLMTQITTMV